MELIVGENTYVTIDEATAYIEEHYSERDILRVHWTVCPEEYKTMYLLRALEGDRSASVRRAQNDLYEQIAVPAYA